MSRSTDPFVNWQAGHSRIAARELAGEPVPPEWEQRLAELDRECRGIEDARRAAPAEQGALFAAETGRRYQ